MEVPSAAPPLSSAPPSHPNYPDSVDSSPRSRNTDSLDESVPSAAAAAASAKLRFMCSFGGHIIPRPHDKSLCYVGGETRIVVVERHTSLSDLSSRLSKTFLNGRPFTLKYLLPTEDLDSLISVTTDEDLDNMIDEYDRISTSSVKPSRIRLFLFPVKPDLTQSIPVINSSAKTEDWFLGMLNRGFSDSGSVNLLMGFDDEVGAGNLDGGSKDIEALGSGSFGNGKSVKQQGQDVHSVPDSPMLETTSSFGSTSSSPSMANLPPIRVHVDDGSGGGARVQDQKAVGIEDQLAQMGIGGGQKQDEGFLMSSPPTMPASTIPAVTGVPIGSSVLTGEYQNRVVSDDERSDHGVPGGFRKPPTPQPQAVPQPQIVHTQLQQKPTGGADLPSPDSVSSDSSMTNAMLRPKPMVYQDQAQLQIPSGATTRVPSNPVDPKLTMSDSHGRIQMQQQVLEQGYVLQQQFDQQQQQQQQPPQQQHQFIHGTQQQVQEAGYVLQPQFEQQQQQQPPQQQHQFIHGTQQQVQEAGYVLQPQFEQQQQQFIHGTRFIHHAPSGAAPLPTFYPMYPSQQQFHPQHHHQLEQQYQIYYVPTRQTQPYNLSAQQPNVSEAATAISSSHAQTTSNPTMVPPSAAYNAMRNAPVPKSEMTAGAYRTAISVTPQVVQVASDQNQQQFVAYSQYHPSQAAAANSAAPAGYAFEYADPAHTQIYFSQPLAPTMPSQYQTMTGAAVHPEVSAQPPSDSMKQHIRTSQPQ
ncbi:hypothetical protein QN277_003849 [Acacia crassicarpa]|uniref:PB1 domain-containing protein n=1 Tax=Acacia crassicarpa TaxID=499986 RepID=A0AAE1J1A6_9FABA|nr:hypothetical protein QN277_003849 [Acacia crassicarpa]